MVMCLLVVSVVYITFVHTTDMLILQNGLDTKVEKSRKQLKERKNRAKKIRGVKKVRQLLAPLADIYNLFCSFWFLILYLVQTKAGDAAKAGKKK